MRFITLLLFLCCTTARHSAPVSDRIVVGAEQLDTLLPRLQDKRIALLVNHTAMVGPTHLADTLLSLSVNLKKIFCPEHGFRGTADAGEEVDNSKDGKTGLPLVSLYGDPSKFKPTPEQLADVDIVVFDIQDVGARFFTYPSTLAYMMEACAENHKKLIILDRPNPNGDYVDGPILQKEFKSFVGMFPIPIVHGLTIGELARMINGEGWLTNGVSCELEVIPVMHYTHDTPYSVPVKPSPNLATDNAIRWYPSTCLFEGTAITEGRGTMNPFEIIGSPDLTGFDFQFTPVSIDGMAKHPRYENQICYGLDLRKVTPEGKVSLKYLLLMYQRYPKKEAFFKKYFNTLAGSSELQEQIKQGMNEAQIRSTWQPGIDAFRQARSKYLLYPED